MNMIGLMFSRNFREYFSASLPWYENSFLFAMSACQPPHQLFFWLLYHNLCSNHVFNTITPLGFPARVAYLDVTRQEFSFVASSLRVVDQHLLAIDLTSTRQEVSSRYVISILWVLSNEKLPGKYHWYFPSLLWIPDRSVTQVQVCWTFDSWCSLFWTVIRPTFQ